MADDPSTAHVGANDTGAGAVVHDGDWSYRLNDDGTAILLGWHGDIYDTGGVDVVVPEAFGPHVLVGVEGDPFEASRLEGLVDSGWLPGMGVTSRPDSPVRTWCSYHASDYLLWSPPEGFDEHICKYTVLDSGFARIDSWWCCDRRLEIPSTIDGHRVSELGEGSFSFIDANEIVFPEGITNIGNNAFRWCDNIVCVNLPATLVRIGDGAFRQCLNLEEVILPQDVREIGGHAFCECSLAKLDVPQSLKSIGSYAFEGCDLVSITLPEGLCRLGEGAFSECWELESVVLPESLEAIARNTFEGCSHLRSVVVPEGVTSIGGFAFYLSGVEHVMLPKSVEQIDDHAFVGCNPDVRIDGPSGSYARRWCSEHGDLIGASLWDLLQ